MNGTEWRAGRVWHDVEHVEVVTQDIRGHQQWATKEQGQMKETNLKRLWDVAKNDKSRGFRECTQPTVGVGLGCGLAPREWVWVWWAG